MSCLLSTQEVSRTPHLQVFHRDSGSPAQIGGGGQCCQAIVGHISHGKVIVIEQVGITSLPTSTNPTPELVQLGEAITLSAINDQGVGVRDIEPGFDDGRGDQHIEASLPEIDHDPLEVGLPHLPVGDRHPSLRNELLDPGGDTVDAGHPVVHKEDLAFAQKLTPYRGHHLGLVVGADKGQDGVPCFGRCGEGGHFPNSGDRHLEGPGYRGCRHGQHIHVGLQGFQGVFVLDSKTLLFIDNHEA